MQEGISICICAREDMFKVQPDLDYPLKPEGGRGWEL